MHFVIFDVIVLEFVIPVDVIAVACKLLFDINDPEQGINDVNQCFDVFSDRVYGHLL